MKTRNKRELGLGATLIMCASLFARYKIFRSPELDHEIAKFEKKEMS